jgi:N-methylhydantoinase B
MNAVELEIFRHVYASIAEEMGATLMRSAFSPNIKERRDYSCAVFDADAGMVAQAAHIPVHLGSTPMSVRAALDAFGSPGPDDHVILNDPYAGGTHLPDITLVSPVHDDEGRLRFIVANRAHHADVGGITPGSLPLSSSIDEEGIRLPPTLWSEEVREAIAGASRTPDERRGDLRAQFAANLRGRKRLKEWLGRPGFIEAATELQDYSERFMRAILADAPDGRWTFVDTMDDDGHGTRDIPIRCELILDGDRAIVDFAGTSPQVTGPINVPRSVTVSAVLYAFRCLAPPELPSNAGYMRCIDVRAPRGTLVDARPPAAVAVGNVETSQRITDVVFGALAQALPDRVPAASCGSMNNITMGGDDPRTGRPFAYYETLAGGSGAGPGWSGASAVHTHMTNTLNTPVEALEHAYPFRVVEYAVRRGSGGEGKYRGGDGVVRAYRFDSPATVTLMTERRTRGPWGLNGGGDGRPGRNILQRDGESRELAPKTTFEVRPGDVVRIETPGGGGFGVAE